MGWGQAWTQWLGTDNLNFAEGEATPWDAHVSPNFDDKETHVRSAFTGAEERSPLINSWVGATCITGLGEMNWPPVSTLYRLTGCWDSQVKAFRNTAKRTRKITKQWGFYHSCLWTVQHYVCDAQFWAPGREACSLSLSPGISCLAFLPMSLYL